MKLRKIQTLKSSNRLMLLSSFRGNCLLDVQKISEARHACFSFESRVSSFESTRNSEPGTAQAHTSLVQQAAFLAHPVKYISDHRPARLLVRRESTQDPIVIKFL